MAGQLKVYKKTLAALRDAWTESDAGNRWEAVIQDYTQTLQGASNAYHSHNSDATVKALNSLREAWEGIDLATGE